MNRTRPIPGFNLKIFERCRILFSLCILADAAWYFASFEVRSAYFRHLGLPIPLIYLIIVVYTFFGLRLLLNYKVEKTCLGMIIAYTTVSFLVHHPVGDGGIGDYPVHIHGEVNFLNVLTYLGLIGGLLVMLGSEDMLMRKKIMHGSKSYGVILGRALFALHFLLHAFYFRMVQYSLRSKQIALMGDSPFFHIFVIGAFHVIGSYQAWLGKSGSRRKMGALSLAAITAVMILLENASLATSVGVYHMKTEARIHQFIVQFQVIATSFLLYSTAGIEIQEYKKYD